MTEGRLMLWLLYCLPLLFKVLQRSGSCCGWLYCLPLLFKVLQKNGSSCGSYIVYHYCLSFERGVVHVVVVILSTIAVWSLTEECFMLLYGLPLLFNIWQRSGSCYCCYFVYYYCLRFDRGRVHVVGDYIVYHYCLRFDRGVVHVVAVILSTITF